MNTSKMDFASRKRIVKGILTALGVAIALCVLIVVVMAIYNAVSEDGVTFSGGLSADELTETVADKQDSLYGSLILVNKVGETAHEYTFPEEANISNLYDYHRQVGNGQYVFSGSSMYIDSNILDTANKMLNSLGSAVKTTNSELQVSSAYRSYTDQEGLNSTIPAGYSDHHTGYSISLRRGTASLSPEDYEWIGKNAHDYGFVIRYPEDKAHLTGVTEYTNCLRYVGVAHANLMKQKGLCLEEYIEFLKDEADKSPVSVKCDNGSEYFIYYYKFEGKQININVPKDADKYPYEISGTNDGGIVVTVKVK